jgi:two-component system, OmpR family, response regulator QseB
MLAPYLNILYAPSVKEMSMAECQGNVKGMEAAGREAWPSQEHLTRMRILIVEDDPRIHRPLADDLRQQRHSLDVVEDGITGLDFARTNVHDVVILDILLPGLDGLEICKRLRAEKSTAHILMLTALDSVADKVAALDHGADDYIVKPFDLAEVSARIRALGRRPRAPREPLLTHGKLCLDPTSGTITCMGVALSLTATEYAILETLLRSPMQVFSRRMLRDKTTAFDGGIEHDSIKTHITNIRRKIRAAGAVQDPIQNVYGIGYRLAPLGS